MRESAKFETLAGGIGRTEKTLKAAAQIGGADQVRFRGRIARLNKANRRFRGKEREEFMVALRRKVEAGVEIEHQVRILRPGFAGSQAFSRAATPAEDSDRNSECMAWR